MIVGFCSTGSLCYSEWWVWDLRTLAQFQESEMAIPGLFQDFMDGYVKPWYYPLVVEHSAVVMTAGSHQDDPKLNANFRFPIYGIWVQN